MSAKYEVGLVDLGEHLPVSLEKLAREMNGRLTSFTFLTVEPVTATKIGSPTIADEWHDVADLLEHLRQHVRFDRCDFLIGVTDYKMTEKGARRSANQRDYFSQSDCGKVSVLSLNDSIYQRNPPGRSRYQYLGFLLMCELLINLAGENLSHKSADHCLFDECEDRRDIRKGMDKGEICSACVARLKKRNISQQVISEAEAVLRWCRSNSLTHDLVETIKNPLTGLALGTGAGWLSTTFLSKQHLPFVLILIAVLPVLAFVRARFRSK